MPWPLARKMHGRRLHQWGPHYPHQLRRPHQPPQRRQGQIPPPPGHLHVVRLWQWQPHVARRCLGLLRSPKQRGVGPYAVAAETTVPDATTTTRRNSTMASSSSLSPFAIPFRPVGSPAGRPKARRWVDDSFSDHFDEETPSAVTSSPYLDAVRWEQRQPQPTSP